MILGLFKYKNVELPCNTFVNCKIEKPFTDIQKNNEMDEEDNVTNCKNYPLRNEIHCPVIQAFYLNVVCVIQALIGGNAFGEIFLRGPNRS